MTSNQLFPSSPEQVALTYPGIWLTTKKRDRSNKEIVRDAAAVVVAFAWVVALQSELVVARS